MNQLWEQNEDRLSEEQIRANLKQGAEEIEIEVFETIDSTNNYAKTKSTDKVCLIVAEEQTAGRGRRDHEFYSPHGTGIYMSIVFPVKTSLAKFVPITVAASVAVVQAVQNLTGISCEIKWVNDIYLDGKKICGILAEAAAPSKERTCATVVVGIGLNVWTKEYPKALQDIAGSLCVEGITRNELIAEITNELSARSKRLEDPELMEEYRAHSLVIGKEITWQEKEEARTGRVREINAQGHLVVDTSEGEVLLTAGEISIRPTEGR